MDFACETLLYRALVMHLLVPLTEEPPGRTKWQRSYGSAFRKYVLISCPHEKMFSHESHGGGRAQQTVSRVNDQSCFQRFIDLSGWGLHRQRAQSWMFR